ncbi:MAG: DUF3794 domain-containing protein [Clostridia bacterium]|nr:DUF3794 domain-containing protein [Clostridia bacterium]
MVLIKEKLVSTSCVGKGRTNQSAEVDLVLTEDKPDVKEFLYTEAKAVVNGTEVQNGRVLVYGTVKFCPIYLATDGQIKSLSAQTTFTDVIDVLGAEQGMKADVCCKTERVEFKNLNGRKLTAKAMLEIEASVMEETEQEAVSQVEEEKAEVKREKFDYVKKNATVTSLFNINDQVEISGEMPAVFEILKADGKISNSSYKIINNKIVIKANLDTTILYTDDKERKPCFVSVSVPFTEVLEVEGITEDWNLIQNMEVCEISCKLADDSNTRRIIDIDALVESRTETSENKSAELISDCFGIEKQALLTKEEIKLKQSSGEVKLQSGIRGQIEIKEMPPVSRVYNLAGKAKIQRLEQENGQIALCGVVATELTYISDDENRPICSVEKELPFKELINSLDNDNSEADLEVHVTGMSYTLSDASNIEVRGNVEIKGMITKTVNKSVITDITMNETEGKSPEASLTVCFVNKNDSLWDIAKRYSTSIASICEVNNLKENEMIGGKKLIVPKYR